MTFDHGDALGDRLRNEISGWRPSQSFEAATVARALQARRRRRQRTLVAVAGLTAVVVLFSGSMLSGILLDSEVSENDVASGLSAGPTESSSQDPAEEITSSSRHEPLAWARRLPLGPPPSLPFEIGGIVYDGDARVQIPADGGGLEGRVEGGWLVLEEHDNDGRFWSQYGILRPSGALEPLPVPPTWNRGAYPAAVSPDGTLVAYRGLVADVRTLQIVDQMPAEASYVYGWSSVGVVYGTDGPSGQQMLWRPEGSPARLTSPVSAVYPNTDLAITRQFDCGGVSEVAQSGSVQPVLQGCGDNRPVSLSEDGSHVLFHFGEAENMLSGDHFPNPGVPTEVLNAGWQPVWEDNDDFLFVVEGEGQVVGRHTAVIVRCSVRSSECEQAGPELRPSATDEVAFDFFQ